MKKLLLFSTLLLAGLAQAQNLHFVSSTPVANANGVARNANIIMNFNAHVDATTVNANNIIISGSQTGLIAGSFSGGGTFSIVFDPTIDFKPGETIYVSLTVMLASTTGSFLSFSEQFEFHAASSLVTNPIYFPQNIASADEPWSVFAVDMDSDGDMDALSASENDNTIAWYENNGAQNFTAHDITTSANGARSVFATDMDSDGDMDALSASTLNGTIAWHENNGSQSFTSYNITTSASGARSVYAIDVDGDGDMDVLSASDGDDTIAWYENDGSQNFTAYAITATADGAQDVYAADMDGDGDMDALSASYNDDTIAWHENNGSQNFTTHAISTNADYATSVHAVDLDNDGDMDVLSASYLDDTIAWYENNGTQIFTAHSISNSVDGTYSVHAADMDGDGDMDVLSTSEKDDTIAWHENDGTQNFITNSIYTFADGAKSVYAADMDGDGDMDALSASGFDDKIFWHEFLPALKLNSHNPVANANAVARNANIYLYFDDVVDAGTVNANNIVITGSQTGLIAGSFSGGGTSVVTFNTTTSFKPGETIQVTLTTGVAGVLGQTMFPTEQFEFHAASDILVAPIAYTTQNITAAADGARDVYAADMDGDGDIDALSASFTGDKIVWHENHVNQNFSDHSISTSADGAYSVFAADMDGDGDMDALSASFSDDKIAWYENNGSQSFTAHAISVTADGANSVHAVDMDGDGDMDALSASGNDDTIAWYENNGSQNFTPHTITTSIDSPKSVYATDMDGDGDMDVLSASYDIGWLENNGNQNFTAHVINPIDAASVHAVDMDGDGDMDALSASPFADRVAWYENNGSQSFTSYIITSTADRVESVHAADMDGDGDMDALSASMDDDKIAWYENDGAQNFIPHSVSTTANAASSIFAADMDGDGDMDALSAAFYGDNIEWHGFSSDYDYIYENNAWTPGNPSGTATASEDVLVLEGSTSLTADTQMNNLTIYSGATLNIEQVLTVNGKILNNSSLVFVNTATKLGQLADMTGASISGSGEVTVQRHIPARDAILGDINGAYRYLSSAVNSTESIHTNWQEGATGIGHDPNPGFGMFITGSTTGNNGFDQTVAGAPSMFTFDGGTQAYVPVPNTDVNNLVAGQAYAAYVWGDRGVNIISSNDPQATTTTLLATGNLVLSAQAYFGSSVAGEFNLFGNPYQAIVDIGSVLAGSTNLNANFYYVWDPNLGTRGAYATVILPSGASIPGTSEANQFLQPGQAAFFSTLANGLSFILFQEPDKDVSQTPTDVFKPQNVASIELQLFQEQAFNNGGPLSDALRINFSPGESNSVMANDAPKLWNFDETIALSNGNEYLAVENRDLPINGESLQLHNAQYRVSDYVFKAIIGNMPNNITAYLNDAHIATQTLLGNNTPTLVNFSVDASVPASIAPDRFSIVFAVNGLSTEDFVGEKFTIYPNPVENGRFFMTAPKMAGEEVRVSLYDPLGRKVLESLKTIGADNRAEIKTGNLQAGIYMVKMEHEVKSFSQKLIVR